jgi:hypothetical protein
MGDVSIEAEWIAELAVAAVSLCDSSNDGSRRQAGIFAQIIERLAMDLAVRAGAQS